MLAGGAWGPVGWRLPAWPLQPAVPEPLKWGTLSNRLCLSQEPSVVYAEVRLGYKFRLALKAHQLSFISSLGPGVVSEEQAAGAQLRLLS